MNGPLHTVHVRVNDENTGKPVPVRVRFTDPEGNYHAPFGRLAEFATGRNQDVGGNLLLGRKAHAYIDGGCEVRLPAGPIIVEASRGLEYEPLRVETVLAPGKMALRLGLRRWVQLREQGWYSGDVRCHFLTPHAALLEGEAEDLAVVNLLATECAIAGSGGKTFPAIPNILAFSGQAPALERPGHLVVVNTLNTHPLLGSLGLLNCHRVVYPLSFGGPEGLDNWALADWCDQCHRKGGLVVWARAWHETEHFAGGEPLADLVLGKVDAFEIDFFEDSPFDVLADWYTLLNSGFRVPLAGGSGKDGNGMALGSMRTYARLQPGEGLTYKAWIEAVRAGRTFATNGPLLSFTAGEQEPGGNLVLGSPEQPIHVRAEAQSVVPFERLEVVGNGVVLAAAEASGSPAGAVLEADVALPTGGWLAARCRGTHLLLGRPANQRVFAHTSPVYVRGEVRAEWADPAAVATLGSRLERMLEWVVSKGRFANEQQKQHLAGVFENARAVLAGRGNR